MTLDPLQAFVDDLMPEAERRAFAEHLEREPELAQAVTLQREITGSIRRTFSPPEDLSFPVSPSDATAPSASSAPRLMWIPRRPAQLIAIAASLLMTVVGVWLATAPSRAPHAPGPYATVAWRSAFDDYTTRASSGFAPEWSCEGEVFEGVFRDRHGIALQYNAENPAGVVATGLVYTNVLSPRTTGILVRADAQDVLVLVDRLERETAPPPASDAPSGLFLHRRTLGQLVLYEVSPFAQPRALDAFFIPEATSP